MVSAEPKQLHPAARRVLAAYGRELVRRNLAPATRALYLATARRFCARSGGDPRRLTPDAVRGLLARRAGEVAGVTYAGEISRLRRFLASLPGSERLVAALPSVGVPSRQQPQLSQAQVCRLLQAAGELPARASARALACRLRDRACVELLYGVGLRASELLAAQIGDLDLQGGALLVRRAKRGESRAVPLPPAALPHLQRYLVEARPVLATPPARAEPGEGRGAGRAGAHLVLARDGAPLTRDGLRQLVRRAGERAGVDVHPHQLRRALATHLVAAGVGEEAVRLLLGHARLSTTARYVGVERSELRRTVERLEHGLRRAGAGGATSRRESP